MNKILSYIAKQTICIATTCLNIATACLSMCFSEFTMKHITLSNDFAEFEVAMVYTILLLLNIEILSKILKNKKK